MMAGVATRVRLAGLAAGALVAGLTAPLAPLAAEVPDKSSTIWAPSDEQPQADETSAFSAAGLPPPAPERVGASTDPVLAAIDISRATFADGEATHALIGRDDVFADSLAGSVLAGTEGPLLYTTGGPGRPLRPEVLDELGRVLGAGAGCRDGSPRVFLLGGAQAVSAEAEQAVAARGHCTHRFAGQSRVETALEIAQWTAKGGPPSEILLARADLWADAATGGAYAAASGTPVLVTQSERLHPAVQAQLARWRPRVTLLGGEAALSDWVEADVGSVVGTGYYGVRRIAGPTRDYTAGEIGIGLWRWPHSPQSVVLVNGTREDSWTWALAAAPLAARRRGVELYAQRDALPEGTVAYLRGWFWGQVIAVGPESVLSSRTVTAAVHRQFPDGDLADRYTWLLQLGNTGEPARWNPCEELRYVVRRANLPDDGLQHIHEAFARIAEASGLRFRYLGMVDDTPALAGGPPAKRDDARYAPHWPPILVSFTTSSEAPQVGNGMASPAAEYSVEDNALVYVTGEVAISRSWYDGLQQEFDSRTRSLRRILVHEIGHVVGLGHPRLGPGVMTSGWGAEEFGAGDRYGLHRFGAGSPCLTTPPVPGS